MSEVLTRILADPEPAYNVLRYFVMFAGSMWALVAYQKAQRTLKLHDYADAAMAVLVLIAAAVIMR